MALNGKPLGKPTEKRKLAPGLQGLGSKGGDKE